MRWIGPLLVVLVGCNVTVKCGGDSDPPSPPSPPSSMDFQDHRMTKKDLARSTTRSIAFEAYNAWSATHPGRKCPDKIDELAEWSIDTKFVDPWGSPYKLLCGPTMPAGQRGVLAISAGEDMKFETADDITSSDP